MAKDNDPQLFQSGYERNHLDRYLTHPWMTQELVKHVGKIIVGPIWECAAGRGDMSCALVETTGHRVYSTDLDMSDFDSSIGPGHEKSFLDEVRLPDMREPLSQTSTGFKLTSPKSIITNPPYGRMTDKFIRKGLGFFETHDVNFMAMLLRSEYRSGKTRADMFGDCEHYMGELVLTTRPRWDYGDPDAPENAAPRHNFSWFLWSKNCRLDGAGRMYWHPKQFFSYMPKGFKP